jgi:hypothetical protein
MPMAEYDLDFFSEHGASQLHWPKLVVRNRASMARTVFLPEDPTLGGPPQLQGAQVISLDEELGNEMPTAITVRAWQGSVHYSQTYREELDPEEAASAG